MSIRRRTPAQQRSRDTVDVLLETAAQVFRREGVAATTNRIAERAGVSIGSLRALAPGPITAYPLDPCWNVCSV